MNWYFNTHVALKPKGSHDTYPLLPWSVGLLTGTLTSSVCAGSKGADDGLQAAMDKFEAAGGYDADKRIANVLTGLGFKQEEWNKSCSEFSGGWQVHLLQTTLYPCMHADNTMPMHRDNTTLPCMDTARLCHARRQHNLAMHGGNTPAHDNTTPVHAGCCGWQHNDLRLAAKSW